MLEHIGEVVKNYLKVPKTSYAIQIDGQWGIGKTHYITHQLKDMIEREHIPNEFLEQFMDDEFSDEQPKTFQVCYVSLNGISTVDEIGEAVYLAIANPKNKITVQGLKFLGKYGVTFSKFAGNFNELGSTALKEMIDVFEKKLRSMATNGLFQYVLIFDDLERIADSLSIKEVFGYINTNYLEHQNAKVIFVSNEGEIREKEIFILIKEKIIGRTLAFKQNSFEAVKQTVTGIYENHTKLKEFFLKYQQEIFQSIQFVMEDVNLRTVRFVFDTFVPLFDEAEQFFKETSDFEDAMKTALLNLLVVSIEHKKGNIESVETLSFVYGAGMNMLAGTRREPESYEAEFFERYRGINPFFNEHIYYFEPITELVLEGYSDFQRLNDELSWYIQGKKRKAPSEYSPLEKINAFQWFTEEEIMEAEQTVLDDIQSGQYKVREILYAYQRFDMLKLSGLSIVEEVESSFREGFFLSLETWIPGEFDEAIVNLYANGDKFYEEMITAIRLKLAEKRINQSRESVRCWFEELKEGKGKAETIEKLISETHLFKSMLEEDIIPKYLLKDRKMSLQLSGLLRHKYFRVLNLKETRSHEAPFVESFLIQLQESVSKSNVDKIFEYNLKELIKNTVELKVRLQKE